MLNSLAAGRRFALRVVLLQLAMAVLTGLVFLALGWREAVAAAAGAGIVALGTALLALRTFAGLSGGGAGLHRLMMGVILKWMAIVGGLIVVMVQFKLPPLAVISGLGVAYAVNLLALRFKG